MVFGLKTTAVTEPSSGRTVGGKKGGKGLNKIPMSKTLVSRPMGRELLSLYPTPDMEAET